MAKDATQNPVPWNPRCGTVADAMRCMEFARTLFDIELNGGRDLDVAAHVRQTLAQWQREQVSA